MKHPIHILLQDFIRVYDLLKTHVKQYHDGADENDECFTREFFSFKDIVTKRDFDIIEFVQDTERCSIVYKDGICSKDDLIILQNYLGSFSFTFQKIFWKYNK